MSPWPLFNVIPYDIVKPNLVGWFSTSRLRKMPENRLLRNPEHRLRRIRNRMLSNAANSEEVLI